MLTGELKLPKLDGAEVSPGVFLIGEPKPVDGKLRGLANVGGALCVIELGIKLLPIPTL